MAMDAQLRQDTLYGQHDSIAEMVQLSAMVAEESPQETQVGALPEVCLALAIALTSPRDACRCAAVSRAFRAAADSDHVWHSFLPRDLDSPAKTKKQSYLRLCDSGDAANLVDDQQCRVWLEKASGAKCYALAARRLSLPWDDGEFSWTWTPHPLSRFAEVAELVECTGLDIYGGLPAAALTPSTPYAAYLVYGTAEEGHRGLSYPDQETTVSVGGRVVARYAVCLRPDEAAARKFWGVAGGVDKAAPRQPRLRDDGWWEMEMGRMCTSTAGAGDQEGCEEVVVASFEVLGWYPKRGLIVEGMEFRPVE
ncbi:F-box protein PP2-B15-like [Phragmites australis]|uniref:F-box protein PP2-B15-like n=1 Tax=Phragmites australis TaxID=29695 RepID=UPI002D7A1220|nr:F-box protein PP2-B15-like [Phragmites australis]